MRIKYLRQHAMAALFLLCFSGAANSQVLIALIFGDKLNSPNLEFGLHAGLGLSTLSGIDEANFKGSLNLGFYFNVRLSDKLWVHPEVLVKTNAGARGINPYSLGDPDLEPLLEEANIKRNLNYVQVPILIKYILTPGWSAEAGVQPSLLLFGATDEFTAVVFESDDLTFKNDIRDEYTALDFGLAGGVTWRPRKTYGVSITARYTHGLVNVLKDDTAPAQRNRQIAIGALIPIGVKKAEQKREEQSRE